LVTISAVPIEVLRRVGREFTHHDDPPGAWSQG
jgi:hypothetical protein